jgi:hypothetical protein
LKGVTDAKSWKLTTSVPEVSCLAYSSTVKMEATSFSETSVDFQRITRQCIPEDKTLQIVISFKFIGLIYKPWEA